jgi:phosphoribosylformimino-5-aminoimidazole carboxamide ribotide isomerase
MYIIPAIDLRNKKCVRLYQGDYNQETVYADDPILIAQQFQSAGSRWLHVVDLDGAKDPELHQRALIEKICKNTALSIQTGGGIRNIDQVEALLAIGVKRIIIGSLAIKQPDFVKSWLGKFGPEKFVLALDVNQVDDQFYIAIHGWQENSTHNLYDFLADYMQAGLIHALCTDISRDGTLTGPNIDLYKNILAKYPQLQLQASGGVAHLEDLIALQENKLSACIIGRALYEGKFTLDEAIGSVQHAC